MDDERFEARNLIEGQLGVCEGYAEEIELELAGLARDSFDAMALGSKLSAARLTSAWLTDCLRSLEGSRKEGS
jgi:hypothetical protein